MDKISVIVPVYNKEKYLNQCIQSILTQTYKNIELILVDDGSTDKSGDICDEWAKNDARVVVIHQKNGGVSKARNVGLEKAAGNWVSFIDSDDWLSDSLYSDAMQAIEKWEPDLIEFGYVFTSKEGGVLRGSMHCLPKMQPIDRKTIYEDIISRMVHIKPMDDAYLPTWIWNKLYKTDIIRENGIRFDPSIHLWEDGIFTVEYMQYVNSLVCLDGNYYNYRDTPGSLSKEHDPKIFEYIETIYEKYRSIYHANYDFENIVAKEYRFQLIHGTILREIKGEKIQHISEIVNRAFSSKKRQEYFCGFHPRNPYFAWIRLFLRCNRINFVSWLYYVYANIFH